MLKEVARRFASRCRTASRARELLKVRYRARLVSSLHSGGGQDRRNEADRRQPPRAARLRAPRARRGRRRAHRHRGEVGARRARCSSVRRTRTSAAARRGSSARRSPSTRRAVTAAWAARPRCAAPRRGAGRALALQLALLVAVGRDRLDLGELEAEEVEVALARALALAQLGRARARARRTSRVRGAIALAQLEVARPGEAVEDLELGRGERELAVLVLAEEGEQARRRAARRSAAVAERPATKALVRPAAPIRRPSTTSSAPSGRRSASSASSGSSSIPSGSVEHALDPGLLGARAGRSAGAPAAHQQVERVREHGLAGPGLTGDRVQARLEAQLGALDQEQVLDPQLAQHAPVVAAGADGFAPPGRARRGSAAAAAASAAPGRRRRSHGRAPAPAASAAPTNATSAAISRIALRPLTNARWRRVAARRWPRRRQLGDARGDVARGDRVDQLVGRAGQQLAELRRRSATGRSRRAPRRRSRSRPGGRWC